MEKVKYSFLYYSISLSVVMALVSGIADSSIFAFIIFVFVFTAILLVSRFVYQLFESLGVNLYEKYIKDFIEKIRKAQKDSE